MREEWKALRDEEQKIEALLRSVAPAFESITKRLQSCQAEATRLLEMAEHAKTFKLNPPTTPNEKINEEAKS